MDDGQPRTQEGTAQRPELRWHEYITINIYWLGFNVASGSITPLLLPYLVALFVPEGQKNTYLANIRVISLAMAMLAQPVAGMLSDRCTHSLGRRRPYIIGGTLFNLLFLVVVGISPLFAGSTVQRGFFSGVGMAYLVLLAGIVLLQISSNVALGAVLGLIPDLVPRHQRGRASGVKAVMELLPVFGAIVVGGLLSQGRIWLTIGIVMAALLISLLITVATVHEKPLEEKPAEGVREPLLRLVALTVIFVAATRAGVAIVNYSGTQLARLGAEPTVQVVVVGVVGLLAMAGSIFLGVYLGAWVGIGRDAPQQTSFIWWVINRLLFLAGVGSIQGFALYYLADVLQVADSELWTGVLMAVVAVFLIATALGGGYLADRMGRRRLVGLSGVVAAGGTLVLLLARDVPMVIVAGSIIGMGAGTFMATSWALGTDLAPPAEAGRYLGISNLAGAGAGIVGTGIGGPMADFFNALRPGLGYLVIFALYGVLFLLSAAALTRVRVSSL
jgi:MFS family permease